MQENRAPAPAGGTFHVEHPEPVQPSLFSAELLDTEGIRDLPTIRERFAEFDRRNPHVFREIRRRCNELLALGVKHFGLRLVWERMRWDHTVQTQGEPWKLNDHYVAYYARKLIESDRRFASVLELRALRNGVDR
jgi:hypothetical protein